MAHEGSEFDTEALSRFSDRARSSADAVDRLVERLGKIRVGSLAFGQFPAGRQLHGVYETLVDDCKQGLTDTVTAFQDISDGVRQSADRYAATETTNTDLFSSGGSVSSGGSA